MDPEKASLYASRLEEQLASLNNVFAEAADNGRVDINPYQDLMMMLNFRLAAPNEQTAREGFARAAAEGIQMERVVDSEKSQAMFEECQRLLSEWGFEPGVIS